MSCIHERNCAGLKLARLAGCWRALHLQYHRSSGHPLLPGVLTGGCSAQATWPLPPSSWPASWLSEPSTSPLPPPELPCLPPARALHANTAMHKNPGIPIQRFTACIAGNHADERHSERSKQAVLGTLQLPGDFDAFTCGYTNAEEMTGLHSVKIMTLQSCQPAGWTLCEEH